MSIFSKIRPLLSHDIGIDLGTANTLVYLKGKGIVINEPSVVAINQKTNHVVAVGKSAKDMLGRTPQHIRAVRPLVGGVISDFEVTEEMLSYFLGKAQQGAHALFGPRVVIGVPSGITNVETRAVRDAAKNAGAREIHIVEEPMAAAIGMRLPIHEPRGTMIVDIGGGTTDIAILALKGIVVSRYLLTAGDKLNQDIANHIRDEFKVVVGERTAEDLKHSICSVTEGGVVAEQAVRGRDLVTGLPKEMMITDEDIRNAIGGSMDHIIESIKEVLEESPPEIVADVMRDGIHLTGGGALIRGVSELIAQLLDVPVRRPDDPLTSVVRGTGIIVERLGAFHEILVDDEALTVRTTS